MAGRSRSGASWQKPSRQTGWGTGSFPFLVPYSTYGVIIYDCYTHLATCPWDKAGFEPATHRLFGTIPGILHGRAAKTPGTASKNMP